MENRAAELGESSRGQHASTVAAKSCVRVNALHAFRAAALLSTRRRRAKVRCGDQIFASHVRAHTFGDFVGERSNRIVAHELREKRELARLIRRA